ncbi:MAG TPA: MBL fold metallo-hydrolase [Candidatus Kapabacteria bacterium]|nr:MBL fold metallo-hydrolase [Candidatus Kapabacteria bacterium]
MALQIHAYESGPVATFGYLVIDDATRDALIVDAPFGVTAELTLDAQREGVTPSALVLTHTHWDHVGDAAELKRRYPEMLVYVHRDDDYRLVDPMKHTVWPLPFEVESLSADRYLAHGDTVAVGGIALTVLHTPGHTEGGICLYSVEHSSIFVGDTLFAGSVGRTDLPGGNWETLRTSIASHLMTLPDDVAVYAGHGETTTIGVERRTNPFVGEGA